jgi:hypothetical protein
MNRFRRRIVIVALAAASVAGIGASAAQLAVSPGASHGPVQLAGGGEWSG